jgi:hypothetical protein
MRFHGFMCTTPAGTRATENHTMSHQIPLKTLTNAAAATKDALGLKSRPLVVRSESSAFAIADRANAHTVMLGEDAFWVVCLADAARLEKAGFEYAPRP